MCLKGKQIMETKQENVIATDYADVMQKSYIDYAMSVIISRALPDVRDGLKPVQRRTLYFYTILMMNIYMYFKFPVINSSIFPSNISSNTCSHGILHIRLSFEVS